MEGKIILERVPIFGDIRINIKKESSKAFSFFSEEINRLKGINQLGILHDFLNIPPYRKYDYIITMLYLTESASIYGQKSNSVFGKSVKLLNDVVFSSSEEFLKCWCLLYSIGHLNFTFTSEHAFMKCIIENKEEFIEYIQNELQLDMENDIDKELLDRISYIINKERFMEIYKIFTILKIKNNEKLAISKQFPKFYELAKIMILRNDYLSFLNLDRRKKLEKIINYFEIIRKLTFTILDGSISQNHLNINYFAVFEDLDDFMESESYQQLLNDINSFYTSDIFNSPESSYYHYECVFLIENIFRKCDFKTLIEKLLENDGDLDDMVNGDINKLKLLIDDKNKPIDETNKQYIKSELKDHFRITYSESDLETPITQETKNFKQNEIFGGLLFNLSKRIYEVDIYPNSEKTNKIATEYCVLNVINNFYDMNRPEIPDFLTLLQNLKNLYEKVKDKNLVDFKDEVKELDSYNSILPILDNLVERTEINNIKELIHKFDELAKYLVLNTIRSPMNFSSWELVSGRVDFPIFFRKSELELISGMLKNARNVKELELKNVLEQLKIELKNKEESMNKIFYVLAPNTNFLKDKKQITEIDFLLIKYSLQDKKKILKIGEVKPKAKFEEDQCIKQLETILDMPRSTATALHRGTVEDSKEYSVKTELKGDTSDSMILFEKSENLYFKDQSK